MHGLGSGDVFLQKTPISFDVSVRELFFPFCVGGCLVFAQPGGHRDTQYLAQLMQQASISCCSFVPSQLEVFLQVRSPWLANGARRCEPLASISGASCSVLLRWMQRAQPQHKRRRLTSGQLRGA